jgi:hypothetical protein
LARNARIFRDASNFTATTNKRNTTVDVQWGFQQSKGWQVAVDVFVHPGVPRTFRARVQYQF